MCLGRSPGAWRWTTKVFAAAVVVFAVAVLLAGLWAWASHSVHQTVIRAQRARNLKTLDVALAYYADKHSGFPQAHTTDVAGKPMQSWRVLLLPFLDQESLYSQINRNEPWDSPANRRLLGLMPAYYRSPLEVETHGTETNYFAVLGPHAPWWSTKGVKAWEAGNPNAIMLIEVVGSKTPWMKPWDPTLDQLLDILRPESGNSAGGSRAADIMYLTVSGDVRTVDPRTDRKSLRKLFLGGGK